MQISTTGSRSQKKFFTTGELALICNVTATTIFRAITNRQLKASTTPGGHFRVTHEAAMEFLKKNNISLPVEEKKTQRILIVEDNPTEMRMFKRALEKSPSFEINTTGSGYSAGFLTKSFNPDLILLDIYLPDIDGREVAKLVRSEPDLSQTKIIAITGTNNPKDIQDIKNWGFDGVIQKPITPEDLLKKVMETLRGN